MVVSIVVGIVVALVLGFLVQSQTGAASEVIGGLLP